MIKVGIIGYGYWGPNLLRNLNASPRFQVVAMADPRRQRHQAAQNIVPNLEAYESPSELIQSAGIDAVVIASPVATHYEIARQALMAGKHVLVEKPMCTTGAQGEELVNLAASKGLTLMVDHTFLFTAPVRAILDLHRQGELGALSYYDSMRINLGLFQPDVNVLWDLAPHDLSILDSLLGEEPVHIEASGYCHVNRMLPDIAYLTLYFPSNVVAHLHLSWMSPVKVRRVSIGGARKMIVWDDLNREEVLKIYNSGIEFQPEESKIAVIPQYRLGDILSPRLPPGEALSGVVEHFAQVIANEATSIMDGERGLRIVRTLELAQTALTTNLSRVEQLIPGNRI